MGQHDQHRKHQGPKLGSFVYLQGRSVQYIDDNAICFFRLHVGSIPNG